MNVRTQVVPKRSCNGVLSMSVNEHNNSMYRSCFSNPEVQVYIKPTFQDAGVQFIDKFDLCKMAEHI